MSDIPGLPEGLKVVRYEKRRVYDCAVIEGGVTSAHEVLIAITEPIKPPKKRIFLVEEFSHGDDGFTGQVFIPDETASPLGKDNPIRCIQVRFVREVKPVKADMIGRAWGTLGSADIQRFLLVLKDLGIEVEE